MSKVFLKLKLKSLAAESQVIRAELERYRGPKWGTSDIRRQMHSHRINVVRYEARLTHLVYGFLRGREYAQIEPRVTYRGHGRNNMTNIPLQRIDWDRVTGMAEKYGDEDVRIVRQKLAAWIERAQHHIDHPTKAPRRPARPKIERTLEEWVAFEAARPRKTKRARRKAWIARQQQKRLTAAPATA